MGKVATIHQPNYLPWLGFFSKIMHADCFIIGADYQFSYQSVTNRAKIRTAEEWSYLTIPVGKKYQGYKINDIPLPVDSKWKRHHWNLIKYCYFHADYYNNHKDFFYELYQKEYTYLWQFNVDIILYLLQCFEISVEIAMSSELDISPDLQKTDYMIALLKCIDADGYLSGPSGKTYLEYNKFEESDINLKFFKFKHPVYKQRYPGFEPAMSAVDLLFNVGPRASKIIKTSGYIEGPIEISP